MNDHKQRVGALEAAQRLRQTAVAKLETACRSLLKIAELTHPDTAALCKPNGDPTRN